MWFTGLNLLLSTTPDFKPFVVNACQVLLRMRYVMILLVSWLATSTPRSSPPLTVNSFTLFCLKSTPLALVDIWATIKCTQRFVLVSFGWDFVATYTVSVRNALFVSSIVPPRRRSRAYCTPIRCHLVLLTIWLLTLLLFYLLLLLVMTAFWL